MNAGVYTLPVGSRVLDAVEAAGGFSPEANAEGLNLAAYLEDSQRILVPTLVVNSDVSKSVIIQAQSPSPTGDHSNLININTATQSELEALPGIGPVLAQEIIAYRESNGSFIDIEGLLSVKGIGDARFEQIREMVTVGNLP
jgi:competence protein ComEA